VVTTYKQNPEIKIALFHERVKAINLDAKVVLMSAFEETDFEFSMLPEEVIDCLKKPVDIKTLVKK
jgi:DNA-binding NtrC family response regulator